MTQPSSPPPPPPGTPPPVMPYQQAGMAFDFADFTAFRTMITVPIIKTLFWFFTAVDILAALFFMLIGPFIGGGFMSFAAGLVMLVLGPIIIRIYCEMLIVIFRINETLTEIKKVLEQR